MALIASISGVRGTVGGRPGDNLTPLEIVRFAAAYGTWLKSQHQPPVVVIGRDARPSGPQVEDLVVQTLRMLGLDVVPLGLTTTPTTELAVTAEEAGGGIVLTASHNPVEWNALKLLNHHGEFLSGEDGEEILRLYQEQAFDFAPVQALGSIRQPRHDYLDYHLQHVKNLPHVDADAIAKAQLKVVVDGVNSSGGVYVPALLKALGVSEVITLNGDASGQFAHNPEPLRQHLDEICARVPAEGAHLGIVVDPDVDRLVFVSENGELFGEEYTIVAIADYLLAKTPGAVVSNLSSSQALARVAEKHGQAYHASAVGEVNVVKEMKAREAVFGGEGNGGVIYPASHYGRDALVGVGLFLSHLAHSGLTASALRATYPTYYMSKHKVQLTPGLDVDALLNAVAETHQELNPITMDGVKIVYPDRWVHLRKSNTEPIIRIYTEAPSQEDADALAHEFADKLLATA